MNTRNGVYAIVEAEPVRRTVTWTVMIGSVCLITMSPGATAATYYVSSAGSDTNSGLAQTEPWQTLAQVNSADLKPGDSVLFRRGDVWRGQLLPKCGDSNAPVLYGAYGEGPKPLLLGSADKSRPEDWTDLGGAIWSTLEPEVIGDNIVPNPSFDESHANWSTHTEEGAAVLCRRDTETFDSAPASSRLDCQASGTVSSHLQFYVSPFKVEKGTLYELRFSARSSEPIELQPPSLMKAGRPWNAYGAPSSARTVAVGPEWSTQSFYYRVWETADDARITFFLGITLRPGATLWLDSFSLCECTPNELSRDIGNLIFGDETSCGFRVWNRTDLGKQGEFWFDANTCSVKTFSDTNPAERYGRIECAINQHIIQETGCHDVVHENLHLKYGAAHGVGGGNTHHITVRACDFSYIGGGELRMRDRIVRFGNAVEFWGNAHDNLVEGCRMWEIYDTGVTHQSGVPDTQQYNIRYRNNVIWNCEWLFEYWSSPASNTTHDIYFENNTCAFAGGGWGHMQREDPHGMHVGMSRTPARLDRVFIRNNIFYESTLYLLNMGRWELDEIQGVVLDNNCWYQREGKPMCYRDKAYTPEEFAAYQEASGQDAHSIWADPLFVDAGNGDFRLRPESPCIDAGGPTERTADCAGVAVPQGNAPDIGAYEYVPVSGTQTKP